MRTLLLLFFVGLLSSSAIGQDSFERLYTTTQRVMTTVDLAQMSSGGYLVLSTVPTQLGVDSAYVNVTKLSPKGDVDWSMDYSFEGEEDLFAADLVLLERDSFVFSLVEGVNGLNKIICKATPGGELVYAKSLGNPTEDGTFSSRSTALAYRNDKNIFFASSTSNFTQPILEDEDIYISIIDTMGNLSEAAILGNTLNQFTLLDADTTLNNGVILAGRVQTLPIVDPDEGFLIKLDSLGNVEWNRKFSTNGPFSANLSFQQIIPTPDTGYLAVGVLAENLASSGLLVKFDSLGREQVATRVEIPGVNHLKFENVTLASDGNLVIAGKAETADSTYVVLIKADLLGNIQWQNQFNAFEGQISSGTGLVNTSDDGYALATSGKSMGGGLIPYLVKVDGSGFSSCEDTISVNILPLQLQRDTFEISSNPVDALEEREPEVENFGGYTVPTLSLEVPPPFCENEPIIWTFDATTEGAVSYEWSTGETTDSITVMEEGMYTVDVRIETDVCFNLCDTAVISTMGPPMVELADLGNYCREGFTTFGAFPDAAVDSIVWSTGEQGNTIQVDDLEIYSATVANRCGMGSASIQITEIPPVVVIDVLSNDICDGGNAVLVATAPDALDFMWSTGETTDTIIVNTLTEPETFSVTVTNICGEGSDSEIIAPTAPEVNIALVQDSICLGGVAVLAATTNNATSVLWSTGSTEDVIVIDQLNQATTFSVTAFNSCGETVSSLELSPDPPTVGIIVREDSICAGGDRVLSAAVSNALDFEWDIPGIGMSSTDTVTFNADQLPNIYGETQIVSLTANNNCGTTTVEHEVLCPIPDPCFQEPNVFTPNNGDELNNVFQMFIEPGCENLVTIRLFKIYNRWGQLVYETTNGQPWDGTYQGALAPSDVYVYYVEIEDVSGEVFMRSGDVTLIR